MAGAPSARFPRFASRWTSIAALVALAGGSGSALPREPYPLVITPGATGEQPFLRKPGGDTSSPGHRVAQPGEFWVYQLAASPSARCRLELDLEGGGDEPSFQPLDIKNRPVQVSRERTRTGWRFIWTADARWHAGDLQAVTIGAKTGPINVTQVRYTLRLPSTEVPGVADAAVNFLREGLKGRPHIAATPPQGRPRLAVRTAFAPEPGSDFGVDAVFLPTDDPAVYSAWTDRAGARYAVQSARADREYAAAHPDILQSDAAGSPVLQGTDTGLFPSTQRVAEEIAFLARALRAGATGVCLDEPEYAARAGYEKPFQTMLGGNAAAAPIPQPDTRWRAGTLMGQIETDRARQVLQSASGARKFLSLHSPIYSAIEQTVSPQARLSAIPDLDGIIAHISGDTADFPARYAGARTERIFSAAYLEYSSFANLLRGTGKTLWGGLDPGAGQGLSREEMRRRYEECAVALLSNPGIDSFEVLRQREGSLPFNADFLTEINSVNGLLHDIAAVGASPRSENGIGFFVGDSSQVALMPAASTADSLFGLALPLLQRGVPVQALSLDRAEEPGYLAGFKTLLLSYDYQAPSARAAAGLANWVKEGGSLVFVGGSGPFNSVASGWWHSQGFDAPQQAIAKTLGLQSQEAGTSVFPPAEPESDYRPAPSQPSPRGGVVVDLTAFARQSGSLLVRFAPADPGVPVAVRACTLTINGRVAAAYQAGSDVENRFIAFDHESSISQGRRQAEARGSWTYRFDSLPAGATIALQADLSGPAAISAASVPRSFGHTLLATADAGPLARSLPRIRIGAQYAATTFTPAVRTDAKHRIDLYSLRSGGVPVWLQPAGRGLYINVGVAPAFFSASERSATLLRAITQYAHQRAGGAYREPEAIVTRRGRYTTVRTFAQPARIAGRMIDILSPDLKVQDDREIPARSLAILADIGEPQAPPHIGFVSGQVDAKIETHERTGFIVRGPQGSRGAARIHAGTRVPAGVRGIDRLGRPIQVDMISEGSTLLLRYPNHPDGQAIRITWR